MHCRHTNVAFRSCLDTQVHEPEHEFPNAYSHSVRRLCPSCLEDATKFILIQAKGLDSSNYGEYLGSEAHERDLAEFEESALVSNQLARDVVSSGLHNAERLGMHRDEWCPQNMQTIGMQRPGGINHRMPLIGPQQEFDEAVMCLRNEAGNDSRVVTYSEAARWDQRWFFEYPETENVHMPVFLEELPTSEVLVYFSRCGHFNAIFMEALGQDYPDRPRYVGSFWQVASRCGCDGYDWDLSGRLYAESNTNCMFCRRPPGEENHARFQYAHQYMRMVPPDAGGSTQIATWPEEGYKVVL